MEFLLNFIPDSWSVYIEAFAYLLAGIVSAATIITPMTSTPKDDEILAKVKAFIHRFSLLKPKAPIE